MPADDRKEEKMGKGYLVRRIALQRGLASLNWFRVSSGKSSQTITEKYATNGRLAHESRCVGLLPNQSAEKGFSPGTGQMFRRIYSLLALILSGGENFLTHQCAVPVFRSKS